MQKNKGYLDRVLRVYGEVNNLPTIIFYEMSLKQLIMLC